MDGSRKMLSRYITLNIKDDYNIKQGRLSGTFFTKLFQKLPADAFIIALSYEWERGDIYYKIKVHSYHFRSLDDGEMIPVANIEFKANDDFDIQWPGEEYKILEREPPKEEPQQLSFADFKKAMEEVAIAHKPTGKCQHEWYVTSRSSAIKYCRKCTVVAENRVDDK